MAYRNQAVQRLRSLLRQRSARWESRSFVVEGPKLLAEAIKAGAVVRIVFLDPAEATEEHRELTARCVAAGAEFCEVQAGVLTRACDAMTPQPVAAVVAMNDVGLSDVPWADGPAAVVCVEIQDPGNAGAVLRSAGAAGAGAVVFTAGSVDVYNPKSVRSSAGAVFHLPIVAGMAAEEVLDELGRSGLRRLGTVAQGGRDYATEDLGRPSAFVFGNESRGLSGRIAERLDEFVSIPMAAPTESLNVAMAASVLCFEAARQRRQPGVA